MLDFVKLTMQNWRKLLSWDLLIPCAVGFCLAWFSDDALLLSRFGVIMRAVVGVMIAIIGASIAGLAMTLGPASTEFLRLLQREGKGLAEDFWPFWLTIAFAAVAAVGALAGLALVDTGKEAAVWPVRLTTGLVTFFFVWALVSIVQIVTVIGAYLRLRILHAEATERDAEDDDGGE